MTIAPPYCTCDGLLEGMSFGPCAVHGSKHTRMELESYQRAAKHWRDALAAVVTWQVIRHPLPWRVESDWTEEVIASDGYCIAKCQTREQADAIVALASPSSRVSPPANSPQTEEER